MQANRRQALVTGAVLAGMVVAVSTDVSARGRKKHFSAQLSPFNEVTQTLSTPARGSFRGRLSPDGLTFHYRLTVSDLVDVRQAHIHFGKTRLNGGIMVFLCQTATNPDPTANAPTCVDDGTVEGSFTGANIIGPVGQGIAAGAFDAFLEALHEEAGYVNVHTAQFPGGEIRGQVN